MGVRKGIFWDLARSVRRLWRIYKFKTEFSSFRKLSLINGSRFAVEWKDRYPCLGDNTKMTGFDRHYIYHPAWAARVLADTEPAEHVDISSTLNFASLVSAFIPVRFYDFRPADVRLTNLTSGSADILCLPFSDDSVGSLSCMHVVEHVGLGRYGDPLDPDGDIKAMRELKRVLAKGGNLLFVVPVGKPKVMFNAHRIYSYEQIVDCFSGLQLVSFTLISEKMQDGGLILDATARDVAAQNYGCGCFLFTKLG
jgi:SAM-dependent methyltransferase